jgi:hypothetical protein
MQDKIKLENKYDHFEQVLENYHRKLFFIFI